MDYRHQIVGRVHSLYVESSNIIASKKRQEKK